MHACAGASVCVLACVRVCVCMCVCACVRACTLRLDKILCFIKLRLYFILFYLDTKLRLYFILFYLDKTQQTILPGSGAVCTCPRHWPVT